MAACSDRKIDAIRAPAYHTRPRPPPTAASDCIHHTSTLYKYTAQTVTLATRLCTAPRAGHPARLQCGSSVRIVSGARLPPAPASIYDKWQRVGILPTAPPPERGQKRNQAAAWYDLALAEEPKVAEPRREPGPALSLLPKASAQLLR